MKTIIVLHNPVQEDSPQDEQDVLVQAEEVCSALETLGFRAVRLPWMLLDETLPQKIRDSSPVCIFNLVESVLGDARLIHMAPAFLDHLGITYTGASTEAMFLTSHKVLSKRFMALNRIATPAWFIPGYGYEADDGPVFPGTYIIKALWEEASVGIDDNSIVRAGCIAELENLVNIRSRQFGLPCFAEQFIDGREFNLSLLSRDGQAEVLPAAEIRFSLPPDRHNIVGYRAKWDPDSLEYQGTRRFFDFPDSDGPLIENLRAIALRCWRVFELRGYNRVDLRVDNSGKPYVLEINANPCISPDSGFVAAAHRAGLGYTEIIERILHDAKPGSDCLRCGASSQAGNP
ncbi:MAG TPA: ATP-grasp domain-containing protein [Deltaproteobacteria bacterium]|nr:ATP-grasp domain-containing protein [Deltaproteobacteria bacterium]